MSDISKSTSNSSSSSSRKSSQKSESNQVRYTGDWSADSKLSAINNGYWEDPFFRFFNRTEPSKLRRTSLICRGYYVRFKVCDYFLRRIIRSIQQPIQIVSLGCGMDTTYFRILPELENSILKFFELDFKSVITAKKSIILHNEILNVMAADKLVLLHCDLRDISSLEDALKTGDFDFQKPTLFYSECVVNYLRPHENFRILEWITSNVPNSAWLAYEQCNVNDSFGQIMVSHFLKNGCPLLSLLSAQSREEQESQLKKAGFEEAKVINVWDAFLKLGAENPPYFPPVSKSEQQFDEYEQLLATCLHYSVRIGINGSLINSGGICSFLEEFNLKLNPDVSVLYKKETLSHSSILKAKSFPMSCLPKLTGQRAVVTADNTILTFGGSGENSMRMKHLIASNIDFSNSSISLPDLTEENEEDDDEDDEVWKTTNELQVVTRIVSENAKYYERLHASAVYIPSSTKEGESADSVLIFGGRKSPMNPCLNDLIELNLENPVLSGDIGTVILSSTYGKCPPARWRHSMTLCLKDESPYLLMFGGKNTEIVLGDCWWYSLEDFSWSERVVGESAKRLGIIEPAARHSHVMVSDVDSEIIYMIGGMSVNDASLCEDAFWIFETSTDKWTNLEEYNNFTRRIGHSVTKHNNLLIIIGGYGADSNYSLDFFAAVIDLSSSEVKIISQSIPREELFLPFGFSTCLVKDTEENCYKIMVFGGGGNCFSFGTHYNQVCYAITLDCALSSN